MYRNTYVEINLNNLKYNVEQIINHYSDYKYYFGVVKGNAYGHSELVAKYLVDSGINYLVISSLDEGINIRKDNPNIPILCVEPIDTKYIDKCLENNITVTIHSVDYFNRLINCNLNSQLKAHIKVDSGMSRLGVSTKDDFNYIYNNIKDTPNIYLEGVFSHFATVGIYDKEWEKQLNNFKSITSDINLADIPIVHLGNSITLVNHPKISFCNGIRLGIVMYGYIQNGPKASNFRQKLRELKRNHYARKYKLSPVITDIPINFKPAFSLYSEVIQVKLIKKGDTVSYGAKYVADSDTLIAIIPIGYADGIRKACVGYNVVINGKKYPIIGDVCMGMIIVKVDNSVKCYDKVTIIGDENSIFSMSRYVGTSVYEVLCNISPLVPRKLVLDGKQVEIDER